MGYGIIGTIVIGFLAGLVARFLKPGDDGMGFIFTTVLGIAGAFIASFLGQALGLYQVGQPVGFIGAVIGAIILLVIVGFVRKKS